MIDIKNKSECCGCGACYNTCPSKAIAMLEDEYGFKYPEISKEKCTECGLCEKVCPIKKSKDSIEFNKLAYACFNKNEEARLKSSSGGIFILLAQKIIAKNGVVFGACLDEKNNVKHDFAQTEEELEKFMGSKYVQSIIDDNYKKVEEFLEAGRYVLFTGTPCQVEGLKSFLKKDYPKLYTQDIICHGVPSPMVWEEYKAYRKLTDKQEPKNINFRNKESGWNNYKMKFEYDNSSYKNDKRNDLYMIAFLKNTILRDSCYSCTFKNENKLSDITLGDYWGIQNVHPEMDDNKGVSAVVINSEKGKALFGEIKEDLVWKETEYENIKKYNSALIKSVKKDLNREKFFKNLDKLPFDELVKKYTYKPSFFRKIINKLKYECSKLTKK